ncbi:MAG: type II toxin-antitoxin system prevent-host-death family antitoxin [Eubacteriales bacterium]|nr:type II toxin-antitoxin system prevent-host-death family antitoxin [Eubacteriales bacterium]
MPNIKNISSLRQYTAVLDEVEKGNPVFLTRDGKGKYAIIDIEEYDSMREALWGRLFEELDDARRSGHEQGWISLETARERLKRDG